MSACGGEALVCPSAPCGVCHSTSYGVSPLKPAMRRVIPPQSSTALHAACKCVWACMWVWVWIVVMVVAAAVCVVVVVGGG